MSAATPARAAVPATPMPVPNLASRLFGLGSIFGKTFRDSRRTAILLGVVAAFLVIVSAVALATEFDTVEKRRAIAAQLGGLPPIFQGMLGEMINIEGLGGFLSWRIINFLPVILGIWTIVAMSGLLAGEVGRGSMDLVAATPRTRGRIALEKLGGYLLALLVTTALFALGTWASIAALATLPGDMVGADAVLGHAAWILVATVAPGAVAFAAAAFLGRGGGLALGAIALFGSFLINGYAASISAFEALKPISYFSLTARHRPLAGVEDWAAVGLLAAISLGLCIAGVLAFARRDLLVPTGGRVRLPTLPIFLAGPFTRSLGERLPAALVWGLGLAAFGAIVSFSVDEFVAAISGIPQLIEMVRQFFPNADITTAAGFLQLAFFSEAILFLAVATTLLVAGWASDENERRLELILSAPLTRTGWAVRSTLAVMVGIAVMTAILVAGTVAGAATQAAAGDLGRVATGVAVLGIYGMALAGIGLAVGGLVRPSLAAPVTLIVALGNFLWELIGSIADFPDAMLDLSLSRHLGQPMLGEFDWPGMALCVALAIGGVVLCAVGMRRRDIGR
ncbi:MAG TPA: ABC transporter permease subunit [Candidatus Binatia bacterium]|nr:ABC transporter permease subunit [Candidatus Binatia bacterium]